MRRTSILLVTLLSAGLLGTTGAVAGPGGGPVTEMAPPPPKIQVVRHVRVQSGQTFVTPGFTVNYGCCCGVGGSFGGAAYTMPTESYSGVTITVGG